MWKVLIADDEKKVCELIQYLVPWEKLGLEVAAVAANGLEAIEVLKKEQIDIVITDARMPECDGIELIKWCHQQKKNLKYVVISGYRHFEYAHGALQYGVDYYLLKPINQNELIQSLKEITGKLEAEIHTRQNDMEMQHQISRDRDKLRRHFIGSYIFDGSKFCDREIDSVEEINEEYQMRFADGIYQALLIKVDNVENAGYKIDKLLVKIKETAEEYLEDFGNEVIGTMLHSGVILLLNYPEEIEQEFIKKIEDLYEEVEKTLDIFEGLKMTFGISAKENSIKGISRCIVTAGDAIKYRVQLSNKGIIFYEKYSYQQLPVVELWTAGRKELLENYIRNGNQEGIKKLLFECKLEFHRRKEISPAVIYGILQEVSAHTLSVFYEEVEEQADNYDIFQLFDEKVDRTVTEDGLWKALEELLINCINIIGTELKRKQTKPIRMVKEYIEEHYNEPITLELVAERVNLSANYVSAIFRKEMGVTFSDYITAQRMDAATELLRKTDLSIGEIAEQIGYTDVKYFSKLCKKTLGMKPSEYRKLYS